MPERTAERFISALERLESAREMDSLEAVFSEDCELGNVIVPEKFHGREGVKEFWTKYRDTFKEIRSTFRNSIVSERAAALEWTAEGTGANGSPIHYDGVSVLEFEGDKVKRFRAYFDPAALGRQVMKNASA